MRYSRFAVPGVEGSHPAHDTVPKRYQHLNFFQHECDRVIYDTAETGQLHLDEIKAHADEHDLVRHLDHACRQVDVGQAVMLKWLLAVVHHLIGDRGFSLTALVRGKFLLAEAIHREIDRRRQGAVKGIFQKALPGFAAAPVLADSFCYAFNFRPNQYPARPPFYAGRRPASADFW